MRTAIYYTPRPGHPLLSLAERWFGRSAFGRSVESDHGPFSAEEHQTLVASRARYGFHATLKAPFSPAEGTTIEDMKDRMDHVGRNLSSAALGPVEVRQTGRYLALMPTSQPKAVSELAASVVEAFDDLAAPLPASEKERRSGSHLTDRQRQNLDRWGYAYTHEDFEFHMTLAGPALDDLLARAKDHLSATLEPALAEPLVIDTLGLFVERKVPGPFSIEHTVSLDGLAQREGSTRTSGTLEGLTT